MKICVNSEYQLLQCEVRVQLQSKLAILHKYNFCRKNENSMVSLVFIKDIWKYNDLTSISIYIMYRNPVIKIEKFCLIF